ncbi:GUN4 domain-containing protein [Nodosilinea nodulosa]|uniref:GUN4 domain-containing protein n=1 Tax=Nodosilinea nodulosa TaxID=416001 RepID=UPI00030DC247|nr:GUN4 domain-containing protein [Nodosilinea nodulosa]
MAKNWALVIGINDYNPVNFAPLKYAKQDAERVKDFFASAGFEVCFFTDNSPPLTLPTGQTIPTQPTYGNLITFLQDRFESPFLSTGDNCWFFFAGHGERHQDRDYLMPMDANSRGAEVIAGLTVNYVQERLSRCGADNVIMILDACRSQGSRDGLGIGRDSQKGVITLASCQPTQKAWEIEELGQGAFTYAFLEALQLSGERSCATVERLGRYLTQRVPALCQQYGKAPAQVPRISVDPIEKQHFILIPQYARQADIDLLKLDVHRYKQTNPALAEQICIRLNALAMGADLEVMNLWAEIRSQLQNRAIQEPDKIQTPNTGDISSRSVTASTTTVNDVLTADFCGTDETSPEPVLSSETASEDLLESETGIDYRNLRDLLRIGSWNAADQETQAITLRVLRKETEGYLTDDDFANFPSTDLLTIDRLWTKYSNENFGLTVQKRILLECGDNFKDKLLDIDIARCFGERVGWLKIAWKRRKDLDFSNLAPQGHLPFIPAWGGSMQCLHTLMSRLQECETAFSSDAKDLLNSDKGIDYRKLHGFLKTGDWEAADYETYLRMLEVVGRQDGDWIRDAELLSFPCADLLTIDQLWVNYSKGRFGFSVQKQIYVECGAKLDGHYPGDKTWEKFGDKVGWRWKNSSIDSVIYYSDVTFRTSAPVGHLPMLGGGRVGGFFSLASRLANCKS